jgi:hypothetical protein
MISRQPGPVWSRSESPAIHAPLNLGAKGAKIKPPASPRGELNHLNRQATEAPSPRKSAVSTRNEPASPPPLNPGAKGTKIKPPAESSWRLKPVKPSRNRSTKPPQIRLPSPMFRQTGLPFRYRLSSFWRQKEGKTARLTQLRLKRKALSLHPQNSPCTNVKKH